MGYSLLAVTDDRGFVSALKGVAAQGNYALVAAATGTQGMALAQHGQPDLVVLDSRLPDMEGLSWLKMLRQTEAGAGLAVVVASDRKDEEEMAEAFQWGADDYVAKACEALELTARLRAVLRRRFEREEVLGGPMSLGPVTIDPGRRECRVGRRRVTLRPREFELLEILMRKAGRVLSRVYLLESVWGMSREADTRAVDVGVSRLRRALGRRAARWVETLERFGYRFRDTR